jgi:hypothetical protein
MSEQVVPLLDVARNAIVTFITNENVNPADILTRLNAHFDDEILSRTQMYDWSKPFEEGRAEVENMRELHLLQGKL